MGSGREARSRIELKAGTDSNAAAFASAGTLSNCRRGFHQFHVALHDRCHPSTGVDLRARGAQADAIGRASAPVSPRVTADSQTASFGGVESDQVDGCGPVRAVGQQGRPLIYGDRALLVYR